MTLPYHHFRRSSFVSVLDPKEESDSKSVLLVVSGCGVVSVCASSGCSASQAGSLREDGPGARVGAGSSTKGERGASRRVSVAARSTGRSSIVGLGVSWIVVLVGGVAGVMDADTVLVAAVELEFVVVAGLVTSASGFFFKPLPKGFLFLAIGFCATIRAICGLRFPDPSGIAGFAVV